jgi:hypothetical protein
MSAPIHDDRLPECNAEGRSWARNVLGVPADAPAEQEQAAILHRLEEAQFVPPPQWEQAIFLLAADAPRELCLRHQAAEMQRAREIRLKAEVDRLAEQFFSLPVAQRHTRWRALSEQCSFSLPLSARLEALVDGLDVVPPEVPETSRSSDTSRLIKELVRTFALLPSQREACHEEFLLRERAASRSWQSAARYVRERYPQLVPLGSRLIDTLNKYVRITTVTKIRDTSGAARRAARWVGANRMRAYLVFIGLTVLGGVIFQASQTRPPNSAKITPTFAGYDLRELEQAFRRPTLPPRDPALFPGTAANEGRIYVGESFRRMFNIPADVDVFREQGQFVFRRKPVSAPPRSPAIAIPQRYNPPSTLTGHD